MGEHIGLLPLVMVSPGDIALVSESGEERRRLSNAVLSQMDPEYLAAVQAYNRLLAQRNKMLKDMAPDPALLDVLDARMAKPAPASLKAARAVCRGPEARCGGVLPAHFRAAGEERVH